MRTSRLDRSWWFRGWGHRCRQLQVWLGYCCIVCNFCICKYFCYQIFSTMIFIQQYLLTISYITCFSGWSSAMANKSSWKNHGQAPVNDWISPWQISPCPSSLATWEWPRGRRKSSKGWRPRRRSCRPHPWCWPSPPPWPGPGQPQAPPPTWAPPGGASCPACPGCWSSRCSCYTPTGSWVVSILWHVMMCHLDNVGLTIVRHLMQQCPAPVIRLAPVCRVVIMWQFLHHLSMISGLPNDV